MNKLIIDSGERITSNRNGISSEVPRAYQTYVATSNAKAITKQTNLKKNLRTEGMSLSARYRQKKAAAAKLVTNIRTT